MLVSAMLKNADSFHFDLDFAPRAPTPPLFPVFVWKNQALNHFSRRESLAPLQNVHCQDVSEQSLAVVLPQIYPTLSFAELANLHERLLVSHLEFDAEALFAAYRFRYDGRLEKMLLVFSNLPSTFQTWCADHELSPRDLAPLTSLEFNHALKNLLTLISSENLSRNQGAQALELATELLLLAQSWEAMAPGTDRQSGWVDEWLTKMKSLRFPVTAGRDQEQQNQLAELPWSKDFVTKWTRTGDKSGLEVKFMITSKSDLQKKLQSLERVRESWPE
jgi:hypothetical protein